MQVENGKALDAAGGFTIDSLHKQGFAAIFLGIGKLLSSHSTNKRLALMHTFIRQCDRPKIVVTTNLV